MTDTERDVYEKAIKRLTFSRSFERALLVILTLASLALGAALYLQAQQYQDTSRQISRDRDQQIKAILENQKLIRGNTVEIKEYIKCVLLIRFTATPQQLSTREGTESALNACAKEDLPTVEQQSAPEATAPPLPPVTASRVIGVVPTPLPAQRDSGQLPPTGAPSPMPQPTPAPTPTPSSNGILHGIVDLVNSLL